ncbi:MAG: formimidoylglutamase [Lysinibacillus sp.]
MYTPSVKTNWFGRIDDINDSSGYRIHQAIKVNTVDEMSVLNTPSLALISFECDEGVRRNKGRVGAVDGPNHIKKAMANLPQITHALFDVGTVRCEGTYLEKAQEELGEKVSTLLKSGHKTIVLGGGHETLYGDYLGVRNAIGHEKKLGIINIDAHFDLRKYNEMPSSGTMFNQILSEDLRAGYFVIGIQKYGNTEELFNRANDLGVQYLLEEDVIKLNPSEIDAQIEQFIASYDAILLTLCMDVIAADAAPGVSAPSPFGLQPTLVREIIQSVMNSPKVLSFDICEVNPSLDRDERTAKLAAAFVNEVAVKMVL